MTIKEMSGKFCGKYDFRGFPTWWCNKCHKRFPKKRIAELHNCKGIK